MTNCHLILVRRMKRYIAWFAAALVGAVIGASVTGSLYERTLRAVIPSHIATRERDQEYSCMLSLSVLARLEAGDTDRAKSTLAHEVASYYHHPWDANAPQRQKVLGLIEEIKPKSDVLREELSKRPQ
jgi:hypothetical protein